MKLTEAIREGWKTLPKRTGDFQFYDDEGCITGACAVGAACFAVAPDTRVDDFKAARLLFPQLSDLVEVDHGQGVEFEGPLENYVFYLNDTTDKEQDEILAELEWLGY